MRRMLNVAVRERMLMRNPFYDGEPLISAADETKRTRVLSYEEEGRLLAACPQGRSPLAAIIICALDTGMRKEEILSLTWGDVDLAGGTVTVRALNTKILRERTLALTDRLAAELRRRWDRSLKHPGDLVFGVKNCDTAFYRARARAELRDCHFHDMRHSAATRWVEMGLSLTEVGYLLGHTQVQTTLRYVNPGNDTAERGAMLLGEWRRQQEAKERGSSGRVN